ncbi:hypothetical protein HK098_003976 [Nowakowskiella sp. JEL0407]|nr:hypothetical protein HK098_003976 [Nowakowskiella sp. JEL0407]
MRTITSIRAHKSVIFLSTSESDYPDDILDHPSQLVLTSSTILTFSPQSALKIPFEHILSMIATDCLVSATGTINFTKRGERSLFVETIILESIPPKASLLHSLFAHHSSILELHRSEFLYCLARILQSEIGTIILSLERFKFGKLAEEDEKHFLKALNSHLDDPSDLNAPRKTRDRRQWVPSSVRNSVEFWESKLKKEGKLFEAVTSEFDTKEDIQEQLKEMIANLPNQNDEHRIEYLRSKKIPQINWMTKRLKQMLDVDKSHVILDIGGGRGDLAIAIARMFEKSTVYVLDVNVTSLKAGMSTAKRYGLSNIIFMEGDISDTAMQKKILQDLRPDIIVGLHACGGLTDCLLDIAVLTGSMFAVCTCCFKSQPELYRMSHKRWKYELGNGKPGIELITGRDLDTSQGNQDFEDLQYAALVNGHDELNVRAISIINSVRLNVVQYLWEKRKESENVIKVELEQFPANFSKCNQVLIATKL